MLTSFSIANFKAFGPKPPQRIPLKPITLVFGANSAGKSSLIHSLLLARTAHDTGELDVRPGSAIAGESVDLGGFYQYVHRRHESNDLVTLSFEFDARKANSSDEADSDETGLNSQLLTKSKTFSVTLNIDAAKSVEPRIESLTLDIDGAQLLRMVAIEKTGRARMRINLWETEHPVSQLFFDVCLAMTPRDLPTDEDRKAFRSSIYDVLEELSFASEKTLFPCDLIGRKKTSFDLALSERTGKGGKFQIDETDEPGSAIRKNVELYFERILTPLLKDVHELFTASLGELIYLGPLRKLPKRHLDAEELHSLDVASGASAWLKVMSNAAVRDKVNAWLGNEEKLKTAYELKVQAVLSEGDIRHRGEAAIEQAQSGLVWKFVREPNLENAVESIRTLAPDDLRAYVESNSDLHDMLATEWHESTIDNRKSVDSYEEGDPEDYSFDEARDEVLDALDQYEYYIIEHYQENSDELKVLVDQYADTQRLNERYISAVTKGSERRELSIIEKRNGTSLSHRDIGIGISQILPVLVHAYGEHGKLIAIEQPEIHIHPALQSEIADIFIDSALGEQKNTFLLETHSEHLILRIMKRIRQTFDGDLLEGLTPITSQDVQILYVEQSDQGCAVREMPLTQRGELAKSWPGGFFEEGLEEMFG